jgi:hypothetical protein
MTSFGLLSTLHASAIHAPRIMTSSRCDCRGVTDATDVPVGCDVGAARSDVVGIRAFGLDLRGDLTNVLK